MPDQSPTNDPLAAFGPNEWLVDELYQQYLQDKNSVDQAWWEFFADYRPGESANNGATNGTAPAATAAPGAPAQGREGTASAPATVQKQASTTDKPDAKSDKAVADKPEDKEAAVGGQTAAAKVAPPREQEAAPQEPAKAEAPKPREPAGLKATGPLSESEVKPLRGAAARTVTNMESSLQVPTATSVRAIPAKLLIDNRVVINNHLKRSRGGKVSFTHIIGFALVKALAAMPEMNNGYATDEKGKPALVVPAHVNLGLAIDIAKEDGTRQLLVPSIKSAEAMDFAHFWTAYEDVVRKARNGKLTVEDFQGTTISLTNPGTIGTVHSVPRLMAGQGAIIGVGSLDYPAEWQGASQETLNRNAVSKILTLTSTYDHRIIQGAQSGDFLRIVNALLLGENGFYDEIFESLRIPYEPVRWVQDISAHHDDDVNKTARVQELIHAYRVRGHLMADTDPLEYRQRRHPDLDVTSHGLTLWDLERDFATGGFGGEPILRLRKILGILRDSYCRTIGTEYMHIQDPEQREWIQSKIEVGFTKPSADEQLRILRKLNAAEAFETFLQTKFVGQKRFSLEGGESVIALLDRILCRAASEKMDEVCIGMPHRGRLNVLANIAGKSYGQIFREFEGKQDPRSVQGSGDVKYHLGTEGEFHAEDGSTTKVYLAANPSHLEAVNPVLEGVVRAKQDRLNLAGEGFTVLPVLLHGDAAFAGQGVVAETLNLSQLRGYRTGGTIHVVINNQVGFTTSPSSSRSSTYSTDVARMIQAPIFHVNGDDPEACVRVAELAYEFRQEFNKDVVIDMVCYRRRGHNEGDDPSMTQPLMYNLIEAKRSVRKLYTEALIGRGDISVEDAEAALRDYQQQLERVFLETKEAIKEAAQAPGPEAGDPTLAGTDVEGHRGLEPPTAQATDQATRSATDTAVPAEELQHIGDAFVNMPDGFTIHPKLKQAMEKRAQSVREGGIDWATGELLAFGTLLKEGTPVRLAGQDSPPWHVRPAPRGAHRQGDRRGVDAAALPRRGPGPLLGLRLAAERVRRDGLRVRLLGRAARRPGAVGGAVRRLLQRCADHRRRVHLLGRAEVGPALLRRAAAAARLRGPGPRPLLRAHRAVPHDVRRGQHDDRLPVDAGELLPPAASPGLRPSAPAAHRLHPEVDAAPQGGEQHARGLHHGHVPAGAGRPQAARRQQRDPGAARQRQGGLRPRGGPREGRRRGDRDRAGRAAGSAAGARHRRRAAQVPERRRRLGAGRAAEPGRLAVHGAQPAGPAARVR